MSFSRQMDQIRADLSGAEKIRRFTKMAGEVNDLGHIHTLRVRRQVANLRIPTQGGQVFRSDPGHCSDLMAATIPI
jgi:hypothetical protein